MQHYGIHHLTIEGDYNRGLQYLGRAQVVIDRLQQRLKLGGLQSGADWERLSDTEYLYARVAMGVNAVRIVTDRPVPEQQLWRPEEIGPPDFLSGVVIGGEIKLDRALHRYWPTVISQQKFGLPPGLQSNARLAVRAYGDLAAGIDPQDPRTYAQHAGIKPTMYSGLMRRVVQLLMGYGLQFAGLYRSTTWKLFAGGPTVTPPLSAYESEVLSNGYQVRFDYRFYRTHGIGRGADGRLWLVEIGSTRGIVAMPLPLHPDSQLAEFRALLEERQDEEVLQVLDLLGGLPSGESFPQRKAVFEAQLRAGEIVQLASRDQLEAFYALTPYSSALGWAFNDAGTEAHNTAFGYDDNFWQFGVHYNVNLHLGALDAIEAEPAARVLRQYLAPLADSIGDAELFAVALRKCDRLSKREIDGLLAFDRAKAYEQLDALVLAPIAPCSAGVGQAGRGRLYNPGRKTPYQIKFWEPLFENAVISHDFEPAGNAVEDPGKSDTTMLVFFAGNELKTVKLFNQPTRTPGPVVTSDEEECMVQGTWTTTTQYGGSGIPPSYYSNDLDGREETPGSTDTLIRTSADRGWSDVWFGDDPADFRRSYVRRQRRFFQTFTSITGAQDIYDSAVVWPGYAREAHYIVKRHTHVNESTLYTEGYGYMGDPWGGVGWRVFVSPAGFPGDVIPECMNPDKRRVWQVTYDPYPCSDLIDEGQWLNKCDNIETLVYSIPAPPLPEPKRTGQEVTVTYETLLVSAYHDNVQIEEKSSDWFLPSPDDFGGLQQMYVSGNAFGDALCVVYNAYPNGPRLVQGKPDFDAIKTDTPCFIGVVNG